MAGPGRSEASALEKRLLERVLILEAALGYAAGEGCDAFGLAPLDEVVKSSNTADLWAHYVDREKVCGREAALLSRVSVPGAFRGLASKVATGPRPKPPPRQSRKVQGGNGRTSQATSKYARASQQR